MSFVIHNHDADLDINVDDLRATLTIPFLELLDNKQTIDNCVAFHVRYNDSRKDLCYPDTIVLHSGPNIVSSPLLLDRGLDSLIDTLRERHNTFNHNLSGVVLKVIIKTDLEMTEYGRKPTACRY